MATEWLENLKAGDAVIRSHGYGVRTLMLSRVLKVTPSQVVLPHDERFSRKDGRRIGAKGYYTLSILEATPERLAEVRRTKLVSRLTHDTDFDEFPLSTLEAVVALLDKEKNDADG